MYCHVCGALLEENAEFCNVCGADQSNNPERTVREPVPEPEKMIPEGTDKKTPEETAKKVEESEKKPAEGSAKKKKKKGVFIAVAAIVLLAAIGCVVFFMIRNRQMDEGPLAFAAPSVRIEYSNGDYADSVIGDLILTTKVEDCEVTWSSDSPEVISNDGKVTRPSGSDRKVKLTATIQYGKASTEKEFTVNVIRMKNNQTEDMPKYSMDDLVSKNKDNPYFFVEYSNSQNIDDVAGEETTSRPVSAICGSFTDMIIETAEDARESLYSINDLLALKDPKTELEPLVVNHGEDGVSYTFQQVYNGIEVYGRHLIVACDKDKKGLAVASGYNPINDFSGIDEAFLLTVDEVKEKVKGSYTGSDIEINYQKTVIYNLDEYESAPQYSYIFDVLAYDDSELISDTVVANAATGAIIAARSNIMSDAEIGYGYDEEHEHKVYIRDLNLGGGSKWMDVGEPVEFPVEYSWNGPFSKTYYMYDTERNIQMYTGKDHWNSEKAKIDVDDKGNARLKKIYDGGFDKCKSNDNEWDDPTAVSAYCNMIKVYDWFKNNLQRDSFDGNGKKIEVNIHGWDKMNSMYVPSKEAFYYHDNRTNLPYPSTANELDLAAHEYTHGIFDFMTGGAINSNYSKKYIADTINEAYADIFGWFVEGDTRIGEDFIRLLHGNGYYIHLRDIEDPETQGGPSECYGIYWQVYEENPEDYDEHINSTVISHAAYLMSEGDKKNINRIEKEKLIKLWYYSMAFYDKPNDYYAVRLSCLLSACVLNFSKSEIDTINWAFDQVGIRRDTGDLMLSLDPEFLSEIGDPALITCTLKKDGDDSEDEKSLTFQEDGTATVKLPEGKWSLTLRAEQYQPLELSIEMISGGTRHKDGIKLIKLEPDIDIIPTEQQEPDIETIPPEELSDAEKLQHFLDTWNYSRDYDHDQLSEHFLFRLTDPITDLSVAPNLQFVEWEDPLDRFTWERIDKPGYRRGINAEGIRWIGKNVLNIPDDDLERMLETAKDDYLEWNSDSYEYNGMYYFCEGEASSFATGIDNHTRTIKEVKKDEEYYYFTVIDKSSFVTDDNIDEFTSLYEYKMQLKTVDGVTFWSIYYCREIEDSGVTEPEEEEPEEISVSEIPEISLLDAIDMKWEYDHDKPDGRGGLIIMGHAVNLTTAPGVNSSELRKGEDPLEKLEYPTGRISVDAIQWIEKNVLNISDADRDKINQEALQPKYDDTVYVYEYDGYYYYADPSEISTTPVFDHGIQSARKQGDYYYLVREYEDVQGSVFRLEYKLKLKEVDGVKFWSIYYCHFIESASEDDG